MITFVFYRNRCDEARRTSTATRPHKCEDHNRLAGCVAIGNRGENKSRHSGHPCFALSVAMCCIRGSNADAVDGSTSPGGNMLYTRTRPKADRSMTQSCVLSATTSRCKLCCWDWILADRRRTATAGGKNRLSCSGPCPRAALRITPNCLNLRFQLCVCFLFTPSWA